MNGVNGQPLFEDLARELAQPMMRYLERYVGDRTVAEDLWQETLMRMHKGWSAFGGRSSIKTWVFAIASRVAADYLRHPGRKTRIVELDEAAEPIDSDRAIVERLVVDEMNTCVRQVIDSLPDAYRAALILHDLEGLSAEQTAEICDCSVASAKIRIHRARLRPKDAECAVRVLPRSGQRLSLRSQGVEPGLTSFQLVKEKPMGILKRTLISLYLALLELAYTSPAFAADQVTPQRYQWPWWRELHWSGFGWIFPLICFVMMLAIFLFMMQRGGMGCMWHGRSTDRSDLRDSMQRSWSGQSASALEILNERYAKGEIDKQEYEEKRAAIASTR